MDVIQSWPIEANSGVRGCVRAAEKAREGGDKQTDARLVHYMMIVVL